MLSSPIFVIFSYCNTHVLFLLTDFETRKSQQSASVSSSGSTPSDFGEINVTPIEVDYIKMICELARLLEKHSGALESMMLAFKSVVHMKGAQKFKAFIDSESYNEIKSVQEFFHKVGSKLRPEDCSLLHCLVVATGCEKAIARLNEFRHEQRGRSVLVKEEQSARVQEIPSSTTHPSAQSHESAEVQESPFSTTDPSAQSQESAEVQEISTTDPSTQSHEFQVPHSTESHPPMSGEAGPHSPQNAANEIVISQPSAKPNSLEINAKLAKDNLTVAEYDSTAFALCGALRIPRFLLDLAGFETGCITIKWTTSMDLLPHIQSVVLDSWDLRMLLEEGVVSVQVGSDFHITVGSHDYWRDVSAIAYSSQ